MVRTEYIDTFIEVVSKRRSREEWHLSDERNASKMTSTSVSKYVEIAGAKVECRSVDGCSKGREGGTVAKVYPVGSAWLGLHAMTGWAFWQLQDVRKRVDWARCYKLVISDTASVA